jgi:hypothetical protein
MNSRLLDVLYYDKTFQIEIFDEDINQTVKNRIAWVLNTLPQFLWVPDSFNMEDKSVSPVDLWGLASTWPGMIVDLIDKNKKYFDPLVIWELWSIYHTASNGDTLLLDTIYPDLKFNKSNYTFNSNDLLAEYNIFAQKQLKLLESYRYMQTVPMYEYGQFNHSTSTHSLLFQYDGSIESMFDKMRVTVDVPIITYNNYYKISKVFEIDNKEYPSSDTSIVVYFVFDRIVKSASISVVDDKFNLVLNISNKIDVQQIFIKILKHIEYTTISNTIDDIGGSIIIGTKTNQILFSDFIFNDPIVNQYMSINDYQRNLSVQSMANNVLFIHPYDEKMIIKTSINSRGTNTVLNIHSVRNLDELTYFTKFMCKTLYMADKSHYRYTYLYFEMDIEQHVDVESTEISFDKRIFSKDYTRRCQPKEAVPRVVQKSELREGQKFLVFPSKEDSIKTGIEQSIYVCDSDVYRNPVLIKNADGLFGYQPCCRKTDQHKNKNYLEYYTKTKSVKADNSDYIIATDKQLEKNRLGLFSKDLSEFFNMIDPASKFFRIGMYDTTSSCLECIYEALNLKIDNPNQLEAERLRIFSKNLNYGRQEMYDGTDFCVDMASFLDPRKCIRILENHFHINILLFTKDAINPNGAMIVPNHMYGYFQYKKNYTLPLVMIYINKEQCELIGSTNEVGGGLKSQDLLKSYSNHSCIRKCWDVYDALCAREIINGKPMSYISLDIPDIVSQYIDVYGKTRILEVSYGGKLVYIHTSPLPPLDLPLLEEDHVKSIDVAIALDWFEYVGAKRDDVYFKTVGDTTIRVGTFIGDVRFEIYTLPQENNLLKEYIYYNRQSRILVETMVYLFSKYNKENVGKEVKLNVNSFISNNLKKNKSLDLPSDEKFSSLKRKVVYYDSDTLRDHLIYSLKQYSTLSTNEVVNYYKKKYITNYYQTIYDFKQSDDILLYSVEPNIFDVTQIQSKVSYMQNLELGSTTFYNNDKLGVNGFMYNVDSIDKALYLAYNWYENGWLDTSIVNSNDYTFEEFSKEAFDLIIKDEIYNVKGASKYKKSIIVSLKDGVYAPLLKIEQTL